VRRSVRRSSAVLQAGLFAGALFCLGTAIYTWGEAYIFDLHQRDRARPWPVSISATGHGAAGARRESADGQPWGRIESPELGLSAALAEGVEPATLRKAVGHVEGTAFPGEPGNVVLAGHRDTHFRPLRRARAGDRLSVVTPDGTFRYRVREILIVPPERGDLAGPTAGPQLTLVTCYPFTYVGPAPMRFVVRADPEPAHPVPTTD
jgi:LPXTG-site transpeptidase (sortase) family protein